MEPLPPAEISSWDNAGLGRTFDFFAMDEEVQQWLLELLPADWAPYKIVGADRIKSGSRYIDVPYVYDIGQFREARDQNRWSFWILSDALTPSFPLISDLGFDLLCTFNGLIGLQQGSTNRGRQDCSSFGVVDKIRHLRTGAVRTYPEYLKIFNRLRRGIKKHLKYSIIHAFRDGTEEEDDKHALMSEGAVRAFAEGHPFTVRPGRPLTD